MKHLTFFILLFSGGALQAQEEWTLRKEPAENHMFAAKVSAGKLGLYLVGTHLNAGEGRLCRYWRSADGVKWEEAALPQAVEMVFTGERFVGVGWYGVWSTADGISFEWAEVENGAADFDNIALGNGVLVATAVGRVYFSRDGGKSWKAAGPAGEYAYGAAFGEGVFLVYCRESRSNTVMASEDGSSWTTVGSHVADNGPLAYVQGRFVLGGSSSTDKGKTWVPFTSKTLTAFAESPRALVYVTYGEHGPHVSHEFGNSTATGETFHATTLCYAGDLWIAGCQDGSIYTSPAVEISWPSMRGRKYQVQTSDDNLTWTDTGMILTGDGTVLRYTPPVSASRRFWRVRLN